MANINSVPADSIANSTADLGTNSTTNSIVKTMKISILSKTGKKQSLLIDGLRILAWESFRAEYKEELKDIEYGGYAVFDALWKEQPVHNFTYLQVVNYAKKLEFSEAELINLRNTYYAKKANAPKANRPNSNGNSNGNGNNRNSNGRNGASANNYEEPAYSSQEFDAEELF